MKNYKLIISNIYDDIDINIEFKETSIFKENPEIMQIPEAGATTSPAPEDNETNIVQGIESKPIDKEFKGEIINLGKEKKHICCWLWIILVIILFLIIIIKTKKKED